MNISTSNFLWNKQLVLLVFKPGELFLFYIEATDTALNMDLWIR